MRITVAVSIGAMHLNGSELQHLVVQQRLGAHCTCLVEFHRDASQPLALESLLGAPLRATFQSDVDGSHVAFSGVAHEAAQSPSTDRGSTFSLTGVSHSVR